MTRYIKKQGFSFKVIKGIGFSQLFVKENNKWNLIFQDCNYFTSDVKNEINYFLSKRI